MSWPQFKFLSGVGLLGGVGVLFATRSLKPAAFATLLLVNVGILMFTSWHPTSWRSRLSAAVLYSCFAFYLLWNLGPIVDDGYGPEPVFYWGKDVPMPTQQEYHAYRMHFLLLFLAPYWVAAALLTLLGYCVAPWFVRRFHRLSSRPFGASAGMAMALMLLPGAVSDTGLRLGLWQGPMVLGELQPALAVCSAILPLALLTGLFAFRREPES